jgi:hypothetical protein
MYPARPEQLSGTYLCISSIKPVAPSWLLDSDTTFLFGPILDNQNGYILEIDKLAHLLPIAFLLFRNPFRLKPDTAKSLLLEHLTFDGRDNA